MNRQVSMQSTLQGLPRRLDSLKEVPECYQSWIPDTENILRIILAPSVQSLDISREYLLVLYADRIVYLIRDSSGIISSDIDADHTLAIRSTAELLCSEYLIFQKSPERILPVSISFNSAQKDIYEPVLSVLNHRDFAFSHTDCAAKDSEARGRIVSYALRNYADELYYLGDHMHGVRTYTVRSRVMDLFRKYKTEGVLCEMDGGMASLDICRYRVESILYKNKCLHMEESGSGIKAYLLDSDTGNKLLVKEYLPR